MECIPLGIGGMMPMPSRLTTSVLVRLNGRMMMFDAGEGIQLALKSGSLGIRALDAIAVTHLHADHVLGIPGIMMFRAQNEEPGHLTIFGPPGIAKFVNNTLEDLKYRINYTFDCLEWDEKDGSSAWSWNSAKLITMPLKHSTFCLGYRLEEPDRPGRFHPDKARKLGVPIGPLYGDLQCGKTIITPEGNLIRPEQVLGPLRPGRAVVFATDTALCDELVELLQNADLAFVEGMFALEHQKEAHEKRHMTAAQAAKAAAQANVKRLVLVHISPRYSHEEERILESEARVYFKNTEVAKALNVYNVPFEENAIH